MSDTSVTTSPYRRLDLSPLKVVFFLQRFKVEGTIHVDPKPQRFSDMWDALLRDRRSFLPMTEVTITSYEGDRMLGSPDFMIIEKQEVRAAYPVPV